MVMAASSFRGAVLALAVLLGVVAAAVDAADDTTHLHFFMHDIVAGSNPTAVPVIKGPGGGSTAAASLGMSFGDTNVFDDALTETSASTSAPVGRMQGVYMLSSQSGAVLSVTANILFTSGDYNGSTLAVMGRDDTAEKVRELSVVGGTGKFRMATGYVLWKTAAMNAPDATIELDVYVATNSSTTIDASAPVSPVDGSGSGSGSGGGGTGKSSSDAAAASSRIAGWVVAVAVAVVGSSCWL